MDIPVVEIQSKTLGQPRQFQLLIDPFDMAYKPQGLLDALRSVKSYVASYLPTVDFSKIWESFSNVNVSYERFKVAFNNTWGPVRNTAARTSAQIKRFISSISRFILMYVGEQWSHFLSYIEECVTKVVESTVFTQFTTYQETIALAFMTILNVVALTSRNNTVMRICVLAVNAILVLLCQSRKVVWASRLFSIAQLLLGAIDAKQKQEVFKPQIGEKDRQLVKDFGANLLYVTAIGWCALRGLPIPTDAKSVTDVLARFGHLGRAMQTWDAVSTKIDVLVDQAFEVVFRFVLRKPYVSRRSIESVNELYSEVLELTSLENQLKIGRDHETSLRVELLYYKYLSLMRLFSNDSKARKTLESLSFLIHNMYQQVVDKNPKAHRMRAEPTVVLMTGKTGVGKTSMLHALQVDLLKICGKWTPERGTDGLVYSRCSEQEYWDGYAGQPICVVDEFAQRIDSIQNPNLEFFELIRAANIFPYSLHSAAINEKANNSFKSDFIILTSNIETLRAPSIHSIEAVERRIHLKYDISLIPEVQKGEGQHPWKLSAQKLHSYQQQNNLPSYDMSHYRFTVGGSNGTTSLNYDQFLQEISLVYKQHIEQHEAMSGATSQRSDNPLPSGVYSSSPNLNRYTPQILPSGQDPRYDNTPYKISIYEFGSLTFRTRMQFLQLGGRVYRVDFQEVFSTVEDIAMFCQNNPDRIGVRAPEVDRQTLVALSRRMNEMNSRNFEDVAEEFASQEDPETEEWNDENDPNGHRRWQENVFNHWRQQQRAPEPDVEIPPKPENCVYENLGDYVYHNYQYMDNQFKYTRWRCRSATVEEEEYWNIVFNLEYGKMKEQLARDMRLGGKRFFVTILKAQWFQMRTMRGFYNWKKFAEPVVLIIGLVSMVYVGKQIIHKYTSSHKTLYPFASFIYWAYIRGTTNDVHMGMVSVYMMALHALLQLLPGHEPCTEERCEMCQKINLIAENPAGENLSPFLKRLGKKYSNEQILEILAHLKEKDSDHFLKFVDGEIDIDDEEIAKEVESFAKASFESNERLESRKKKPRYEDDTKRESNERLEYKKRKPKYEHDRTAADIFRKVMPEGLISKAADDLRTSALRNLYYIRIFSLDNDDTQWTKEIGHVFILKGSKALINSHYLVSMRQFMNEHKGTSFFIEIVQHGQKEGHIYGFMEFFNSLQVVKRGQTQTEFFSFDMPHSVPTGKDMAKHLIRAKDLHKLTQGVRVILCTKERSPPERWSTVVRDGFFQQFKTIHLEDISDPTVIHQYPNSMSYQMSSKNGDCGSPVIVANDQFAHKLAGFHFGGAEGMGCGSLITYEDVRDLLKEEICEADAEVFKPMGDEKFPLEGSFTPLGVIPKNMTVATPLKTKLTQSPIYDQIAPSKVLPSLLRPPLEPDGPMIKGLMKNASASFTLEYDHLASAATSYRTMLFRLPALEQEKLVLGYEDAVRGIEGNPYFPPCKRTTSAGWPLCLEKSKGKEKWLGTDSWDFTSENALALRSSVTDMENMCKKGIIPEVYYIDTLKDEKRAIEKVKAGKTRTFSAAPLAFTILFRKYFLGFLAYMMRNRIANESAIGVNPYSRDWQSIVDNLQVFGEKSMIAGDFSNFDGTVNFYIMQEILHTINQFYNDGSQNMMVRRVLWEHIAKSKHILAHFVYQFAHSQPSGNPATAVTNSMYNSIATRYCYSKIVGSANSFNDNVRMIAYGDDNIISVHQQARSKITPRSLSEKFETVGMTYTSETKGTFIEHFRSIKEVTFLKREFRFDRSLRYWFAPLSLDSILEMTNWLKKSPNDWQALRDNLEQCIIELYFHDESEFAWFAGRMNDIMTENFKQPVVYLPYQSARGLIATGRFHEINETAKNMRWAFTSPDLNEEEPEPAGTFAPQCKINQKQIQRAYNFEQSINLARTQIFRALHQ